MQNAIIKAITAKLGGLYTGYPVYADDVPQNLAPPCFFINTVRPSRSPLLGCRSFRRNGFDILCFPTNERLNTEMLAVAETLTDGMEYITLSDGSLLRGTDMSYEIVDGVLHFLVSYNMVVQTIHTEEAMETLELEVNKG